MNYSKAQPDVSSPLLNISYKASTWSNLSNVSKLMIINVWVNLVLHHGTNMATGSSVCVCVVLLKSICAVGKTRHHHAKKMSKYGLDVFDSRTCSIGRLYHAIELVNYRAFMFQVTPRANPRSPSSPRKTWPSE